MQAGISYYNTEQVLNSVLHCNFDQYYSEKDLNETVYLGYGAYDRLGTQPPNQKCKKCGRTWFNKYKVIEANHYYEDGPCESRKTL